MAGIGNTAETLLKGHLADVGGSRLAGSPKHQPAQRPRTAPRLLRGGNEDRQRAERTNAGLIQREER